MKALTLVAFAAVPCATGCNTILGNDPVVVGDISAIEAGVFDASMDTAAPPSPPVPVTVDDAATPAPGVDAGPPVADAAIEAGCASGKKSCDGQCADDDNPLFGCDPEACTPCSLSRTTSICSGNACAIGTCNAGYADCDQHANTGCETDLSTAQHCGACNAVCAAAAPYCAPVGGGFGCTTGCTGAAPTLCGTQCVDLTSTASHCGTCNNVCPPVANATTSCGQSTCKFTCDTGFHACGKVCASSSSPATCGASCTPCTAPANGAATCAAGACGFVCNAGFHACGAACVSDTDPATCGAACAPCAATANSTATCNGTACGLSCSANYGNCDANAANGCEAPLLTDPSNCGACAHSCGGQKCTAGTCDLAPPPPDAGPPMDAGSD